MKLPTITGLIRRRILLNYRISPEVVQAQLPGNFRPKLVGGSAIGGICLIRLEDIRPKGLSGHFGISSENSALRFAVEWDDESGGRKEGVFVPRRDTNSRLNALAGGRIFPGVHHHSQFAVNDLDGRITLKVSATDMDIPLVEIEVSETNAFPGTSIFGAIQDSSRFFENGCIGYSSRPDSCTLDGLLLKVTDWQVSALNVHKVQSAYFDNRAMFPPDAIEFDHALLMRDIPHEWHSEPSMTTGPSMMGRAGGCIAGARPF